MKRLRVAVVSGFYSDGMGYSENCLPRSLAALGHDVHLITSTYNVYGNEVGYDANYRGVSRSARSGAVQVRSRRLPRPTPSYDTLVRIREATRPRKHDPRHQAGCRPLARDRVTPNNRIGRDEAMESLQTVLRKSPAHVGSKAVFEAARLGASQTATVSSHADVAGLAREPGRGEVLRHRTGLRRGGGKPLWSPTAEDSLAVASERTRFCFTPSYPETDRVARRELRRSLGFDDHSIVCLYSGRFSLDKNPLLLAKAIDAVRSSEERLKGLFIGDGVQKDAIVACRNCVVVPFMKHADLAAHYRAADIAVWPMQESMSMLDAAASGLPVVASDTMGEADRVKGNGRQYREGSVESLQLTLTNSSTATRGVHWDSPGGARWSKVSAGLGSRNRSKRTITKRSWREETARHRSGWLHSVLTPRSTFVRSGHDVRAFVFYNSFNTWGWLDHCDADVKNQFEVFPGDVRDPHGVRTAMKGCDGVLHLAALIAIPYSLSFARHVRRHQHQRNAERRASGPRSRRRARPTYVYERGVWHGPVRADHRGASSSGPVALFRHKVGANHIALSAKFQR